MILRDAIISEQRRALATARDVAHTEQAGELESAECGAPVDSAELSEHKAIQLILGNDAASTTTVRAEPELSFERVAAWLAVQHGEMRTACASLLADELTQVHESAKEKGHAIGRREGREEGEREVKALLTTMQRISAAAEECFEQEQQKLADACIDVIAEAFTKLAGSALATPEATAAIVGEVLKRVREGREITVRVSPNDLPALRSHETTLREFVAGRRLVLTADSRVEVGGCIVESSLGTLDGRLEVQLRALYETLKAAKAAPAEGS